MTTFSIWHWLLFLLVATNIAMVVQIAVSNRTRGFKKGVFVAQKLIIPYVSYLAWLVMRNSKKMSDVKDAEMRTKLAEAEACETEAQARIAGVMPLELPATRQS